MASAYFCCYCNLNCFPKTEMPLISKNHVSYPSIQRNFSERCHLLRNLLANRNWSIARPWSLYSRAAFSTSCPASPSFDQLSQGGVGLSSGCSGRLVVCFPRSRLHRSNVEGSCGHLNRNLCRVLKTTKAPWLRYSRFRLSAIHS